MDLDFYKTPPGCYVSFGYEWDTGGRAEPDNILIIRKSYEETKNMPGEYDFIIADIYEPYNIELFADDEQFRGKWYSVNRKISDESWAMKGVSDWDDVEQVPESEINRYIIRALFANYKM